MLKPKDTNWLNRYKNKTHIHTCYLQQTLLGRVLGSIITNKASGGDGIPGELFKILKDDAVKALHSICQQIWDIRQRSQDWKKFSFQSQRRAMPKYVQTTTQLYSFHMLKGNAQNPAS